MPTLHLHRDFAGAELISYLFIEHARNHKTHHLALTRCQRLVTPAQFSKLILLFTRYPIAIQSLVNRIQQVLVLEGLSQELHRTRFHGLHRHRNISMTSDEDDGNADAGISQLPLKIQTIDSRKSHVENKTTRPVRALEDKNCCVVSKVSARRPTDFSMP